MPRQKMPKKDFRCHLFAVRGSGEFPTDMLRYDSCCPVDEMISHRMLGDSLAPVRTIVLRRFTGDFRPATAGRWKSFGWQVVADQADGVPEWLIREIAEETVS